MLDKVKSSEKNYLALDGIKWSGTRQSKIMRRWAELNRLVLDRVEFYGVRQSETVEGVVAGEITGNMLRRCR